MAKREDGKETRAKLLNSACEVFARKGYRAATVADICRRAGANVASVNYYYGDKTSLYREAWRYALERFQEHVVIDTAAEFPEEALREYILTLMRNFSSKGEIGRFSRLYLRELVSPTGLIQDAWHDLVEPRRRALHQIIRKLIGPEAGELSVLFCEQSIINQCRGLLTIKRDDLEYMLGKALSPELIHRFAEHTAEFSLAGIKAVGEGRRAEDRPAVPPNGKI
jgi:AcrR family transcriptional regulator